MWLPWDYALAFAAVLAPTAVGLRRARRSWSTKVAPVARESAILFVFYAIWRMLGEVTVMSTAGARSRGLSIWHAERWLHLPNELTLQRWTLDAKWLVQFANGYYIVAHVAPLGIFLVWLFFRHRDRYSYWRRLLAFSSLVCIVIQFVPVAPPRLYPELGFVDTGAVYGPRVYDAVGTNVAGQLAAMPSMHVAWALLIGIATWRASTSHWRWIGPAHAALTIFAVTVTAYHWIADGVVAGFILVLGAMIERAWRVWRPRASAQGTLDASAAELVGR